MDPFRGAEVGMTSCPENYKINSNSSHSILGDYFQNMRIQTLQARPPIYPNGLEYPSSNQQGLNNLQLRVPSQSKTNCNNDYYDPMFPTEDVAQTVIFRPPQPCQRQRLQLIDAANNSHSTRQVEALDLSLRQTLEQYNRRLTLPRELFPPKDTLESYPWHEQINLPGERHKSLHAKLGAKFILSNTQNITGGCDSVPGRISPKTTQTYPVSILKGSPHNKPVRLPAPFGPEYLPDSINNVERIPPLIHPEEKRVPDPLASSKVKTGLEIPHSSHHSFEGSVTHICKEYGFVGPEIFFQTSVVVGTLPQIGDEVAVEAEPIEGLLFKWNCKRVEVRDKLGPKSFCMNESSPPRPLSPTSYFSDVLFTAKPPNTNSLVVNCGDGIYERPLRNPPPPPVISRKLKRLAPLMSHSRSRSPAKPKRLAPLMSRPRSKSPAKPKRLAPLMSRSRSRSPAKTKRLAPLLPRSRSRSPAKTKRLAPLLSRSRSRSPAKTKRLAPLLSRSRSRSTAKTKRLAPLLSRSRSRSAKTKHLAPLLSRARSRSPAKRQSSPISLSRRRDSKRTKSRSTKSDPVEKRNQCKESRTRQGGGSTPSSKRCSGSRSSSASIRRVAPSRSSESKVRSYGRASESEHRSRQKGVLSTRRRVPSPQIADPDIKSIEGAWNFPFEMPVSVKTNEKTTGVSLLESTGDVKLIKATRKPPFTKPNVPLLNKIDKEPAKVKTSASDAGATVGLVGPPLPNVTLKSLGQSKPLQIDKIPVLIGRTTKISAVHVSIEVPCNSQKELPSESEKSTTTPKAGEQIVAEHPGSKNSKISETKTQTTRTEKLSDGSQKGKISLQPEQISNQIIASSDKSNIPNQKKGQIAKENKPKPPERSTGSTTSLNHCTNPLHNTNLSSVKGFVETPTIILKPVAVSQSSVTEKAQEHQQPETTTTSLIKPTEETASSEMLTSTLTDASKSLKKPLFEQKVELENVKSTKEKACDHKVRQVDCSPPSISSASTEEEETMNITGTVVAPAYNPRNSELASSNTAETSQTIEMKLKLWEKERKHLNSIKSSASKSMQKTRDKNNEPRRPNASVACEPEETNVVLLLPVQKSISSTGTTKRKVDQNRGIEQQPSSSGNLVIKITGKKANKNPIMANDNNARKVTLVAKFSDKFHPKAPKRIGQLHYSGPTNTIAPLLPQIVHHVSQAESFDDAESQILMRSRELEMRAKLLAEEQYHLAELESLGIDSAEPGYFPQELLSSPNLQSFQHEHEDTRNEVLLQHSSRLPVMDRIGLPRSSRLSRSQNPSTGEYYQRQFSNHHHHSYDARGIPSLMSGAGANHILPLPPLSNTNHLYTRSREQSPPIYFRIDRRSPTRRDK